MALYHWTGKYLSDKIYDCIKKAIWLVEGPVIQANGRLTFEDDLRSGGLLYFTVRTELADSMVTLGDPRGG